MLFFGHIHIELILTLGFNKLIGHIHIGLILTLGFKKPILFLIFHISSKQQKHRELAWQSKHKKFNGEFKDIFLTIKVN